MGNTFKTALLLTAMTLFLLFIGQAFGGQRGMVLALVFMFFLDPGSFSTIGILEGQPLVVSKSLENRRITFGFADRELPSLLPYRQR